MGGEKWFWTSIPSGLVGAPPRRRGKAALPGCIGYYPGITPAWAGKSRRAGRCAAASGDHPRVGGEKPFLFYGGSSDSGSPPHGRGKARFSGISLPGVGITPAWAGKRWAWDALSTSCWDYPRVGGEKLAVEDTNHSYQGSPPRRRGKARGLLFSSHCARITPA